MRKRVVVLLLSVVLCLGCFGAALAHNSMEEHWADLERCLFGKEQGKSKQVGALRELELASALVLDQFNEKDDWMLEELNEMKIPHIPKKIEEINLHTSPKVHQWYTHKGWNYTYDDDKAKWNVRKNLLMQTVDHVFDFRSSSSTWLGSIFRTENKRQHESFAVLMYYSHILGDLEEKNTISDVNGLIPLGTAHPGDTNRDLLYDLDWCLTTLFEQQQNTPLFQMMKHELSVLAKEIRIFGRPVNNEQLKTYKAYGRKLQDILENYVPRLLKNEQFFRDVFP